MQLAIGDPVLLRSTGLGRVTGLAARDAKGAPRPRVGDEAAQFYMVVTPTRTVFVPIDTAHELVRPLVHAGEANRLLAILREPEVTAGEDLDSMSTPRSHAVLADGTPEDAARFLRELYSLPVLTHRQGMAILVYEDVVLDELAQVLGQDWNRLVEEMRSRYPAFAKRVADNRAGRSTDRPEVVATPVAAPPKRKRAKAQGT